MHFLIGISIESPDRTDLALSAAIPGSSRATVPLAAAGLASRRLAGPSAGGMVCKSATRGKRSAMPENITLMNEILIPETIMAIFKCGRAKFAQAALAQN